MTNFDKWWRYNVTLVCECFDSLDNRIELTSHESHLANVGEAFDMSRMSETKDRVVTLNTVPCRSIHLYVYIIPHTLPVGRKVDATKPFNVELNIKCEGTLVANETLLVNQWSGASVERHFTAR